MIFDEATYPSVGTARGGVAAGASAPCPRAAGGREAEDCRRSSIAGVRQVVACAPTIAHKGNRSHACDLQPDRGSQAFEQFHGHFEADVVLFFDYEPRTRNASGRRLALPPRRCKDSWVPAQRLHAW